MRLITLFAVFLLMISTVGYAAEKKEKTKKPAAKPATSKYQNMTQGLFAEKLVKQFGWDGGLSKEPKDRDYLVILEGKRNFKFEAENVCDATIDNVAIRKYNLFGPFSGTSWLGGVSTPTTLHLKVFIPVEGEYILSAAAKGDGQIWKIAGKEFKVNSGDSMNITKIGAIPVKAGELEFEMVMPPGGGLDYLLFSAPDLTPIEPVDGWRFKEKIKKSELAAIATSLLGWENMLPSDDKAAKQTIIASELKNLPETATPTDIKYFGKFTGTKWVRAGYKGAELDIPFVLEKSGAYSLKLRVMGGKFGARIDDMPVEREAKAILEWVDIGLMRLSDGKHTLRLTLPMYGGLDALVIEPRLSTPSAYMSLVGLKGEPSEAATTEEMEKLLAFLRSNFKGRK